MTELLKQAKQGDRVAREQFAEQNFGLVQTIAKRFADREALEDLFQIGCIGLLKAMDRFEFSFGVCFSTYAVPYIMGEIKMYLRDNSMIKISRSRRALGQAIRHAEEQWRAEHQSEPKLTDIAELLQISSAEAAAAVSAMQPVESLDRQTGEEGGFFLGDSIAQEDETEAVLCSVTVQEALHKLSARDRKLIYLRYFEKKTQSEIAAVLCLSQVQVSRLEKEILKKLYMCIKT